jgi:hypothetical protein
MESGLARRADGEVDAQLGREPNPIKLAVALVQTSSSVDAPARNHVPNRTIAKLGRHLPLSASLPADRLAATGNTLRIISAANSDACSLKNAVAAANLAATETFVRPQA